MKKIYKKPCLEASHIENEVIMAGSGVTGNNGISWGGVDEEGTKDPDANSTLMWEEDRALNDQSLFSNEEQ
jgi:hypothetical protein